MPDPSEALRQMTLQFQAWRTDIVDKAFDAMQDMALDGQSQMKEHLLAAENYTKWGEARVAGTVKGPNGAGPREHAGRYETGHMYETITSVAEWISKDVIEARWGWQDKDYEKYFGAQEHGAETRNGGHIAGAESIQFSLDRAEDILHGRLSGLA